MNSAWLVGSFLYALGPSFPQAGFLNRHHETVVCKARSCCFCRPPVPRPKEAYSYWPQMHFEMKHVQQWFATGKRECSSTHWSKRWRLERWRLGRSRILQAVDENGQGEQSAATAPQLCGTSSQCCYHITQKVVSFFGAKSNCEGGECSCVP